MRSFSPFRIFILSIIFHGCSVFANVPPVASASSNTVIHEMLSALKVWQQEFLDRQEEMSLNQRPFVLLTFAQSIDGKIAQCCKAGEGLGLSATVATLSNNYPISGPDSLLMTHALRSIHDGILIGGRTLKIDNPRLNNRLWEENVQRQPRPIILDTHLANFQALGNTRRLRNPIVCCTHEAASSMHNSSVPEAVQLLPCKCTAEGTLDLEDILYQLWAKFGIRTLMVEGGAGILSTFLERGYLVDSFCITVAPKLLGNRAIGLSFEGPPREFSNANSHFYLLGCDVVFLSRYRC